MEKIQVEKLSLPELREVAMLATEINTRILPHMAEDELSRFTAVLRDGMLRSSRAHSSRGIPLAILALKTACAFADMVDPDHNIIIAILLYPLYHEGLLPIDSIRKEWGEDIAGLLEGIASVSKFSNRNSAHNQENFRGLMLALAHDIRVIIIMIVENLI